MVNVIARLLVAGICTGVAGMLAYGGKAGWGWFLFAALILGCVTVTTTKTGDAKVSE